MRRVLRWWTYFKRAHVNYTAPAIWFLSHPTILYTLLVVEVFNFPRSPLFYALFATIFALSYFIVATLIGRWDYRRGSVPVETELIAKASPFNRDLALALILIAEGRNREAIEVLRKWVHR